MQLVLMCSSWRRSLRRDGASCFRRGKLGTCSERTTRRRSCIGFWAAGFSGIGCGSSVLEDGSLSPLTKWSNNCPAGPGPLAARDRDRPTQGLTQAVTPAPRPRPTGKDPEAGNTVTPGPVTPSAPPRESPRPHQEWEGRVHKQTGGRLRQCRTGSRNLKLRRGLEGNKELERSHTRSGGPKPPLRTRKRVWGGWVAKGGVYHDTDQI